MTEWQIEKSTVVTSAHCAGKLLGYAHPRKFGRYALCDRRQVVTSWLQREMKLFCNDFEVIPHVTTSETDMKLFQPLKEF